MLLWVSEAWNTRDKIIGTLILPGGLAGGLAGGLTLSFVPNSVSCGPPGPGVDESCVSTSPTFGSALGLIAGALFVIAPIATAIYLSLRLRRARLASSAQDGR